MSLPNLTLKNSRWRLQYSTQRLDTRGDEIFPLPRLIVIGYSISNPVLCSCRSPIRPVGLLFFYLWRKQARRKQVPKSGARSSQPRHDGARRAIKEGGDLL